MKKHGVLFYVIVILIALFAFIAGVLFARRYIKTENRNSFYKQNNIVYRDSSIDFTSTQIFQFMGNKKSGQYTISFEFVL